MRAENYAWYQTPAEHGKVEQSQITKQKDKTSGEHLIQIRLTNGKQRMMTTGVPVEKGNKITYKHIKHRYVIFDSNYGKKEMKKKLQEQKEKHENH